jgi:hypothetical protein
MPETWTTPLDRLLTPLASSLSPEAAKQLIDIPIDPTTEARIQELAEKANEGQLTPAERDEYEQFVNGMDLIAILQIKARKRLSAQKS